MRHLFLIIFITSFAIFPQNGLSYGAQVEVDYHKSFRKQSEEGLVKTTPGPEGLSLGFFPIVSEDDAYLMGLQARFGMRYGVSFALCPTFRVDQKIYDNIILSPQLIFPLFVRPKTLLGFGGGFQVSYEMYDARVYLDAVGQAFLAGKGIPEDKLLLEYKFSIGLSKRVF